MNKILKMGFIFIMIISMLALVACGSEESTASNQNDNSGSNEDNQENEASQEESEEVSDFPGGKNITLIVPHGAGGGTDMTARALAKVAEKYLDTSISVVNKTGGGGAIGMGAGINADPDGYTATMVTVELVTLPHLGLAPFSYEDYKPIAQINYDPGAFAVRADAPWEDFNEFIEAAKNNPGKLNVSNSGTGAIWHLNSAGVEKDTGVEFNHVPFDGSAPGITALLGGHVDMTSASPGEVLQHVKSGDLRVLAVSSPERSEYLPDTPTLKELGIETPEVGPWRGITVPKDTPDDIAKILEDAFLQAANDPEFVEYMEGAGLGMIVKDADGFYETMKNGNENYKNLIEDLGLNQ